MEGTLKVTPDQLITTAGEFQSRGGRVRNITQEMGNIVRGMGNIWEGDAATAFNNKFNQLTDDINRMHSMINEHVNDLNQMAQNYKAAETANESTGNALAGDIIS